MDVKELDSHVCSEEEFFGSETSTTSTFWPNKNVNEETLRFFRKLSHCIDQEELKIFGNVDQ